MGATSPNQEERSAVFYVELSAWLNHQDLTDSPLGKSKLGLKSEELHRAFNSWIQSLPSEQKQVTLQAIERILYYLSSYYHHPQRIQEVEKTVLLEGRMFQASLISISDLVDLPFHQLEYIEEKYRSKYPLYALTGGGIAGTGHPLGLALDLPALLIINMKMIAYIASSYGFSLQSEAEQEVALKVLYAASLSKAYRQEAWQWLGEAIQEQDYLEGEIGIPPEWLETLAKQWLKGLVLMGIRPRSAKKLPLVGMILGASLNYQFTKEVGQFASFFYRKRFLQGK